MNEDCYGSCIPSWWRDKEIKEFCEGFAKQKFNFPLDYDEVVE